jgi:regulator of sirC expression with transglutaminase-like and TPR domain
MFLPMTANEPVHCRPEAFQYFVEQMPELWTTTGLLRASIGVAMHALDDVDPERVESHIHGLSGLVQAAAPGNQPSDLLNALHFVLFDECGFEGNTDRYYHALNSYVPAVLSMRRGLPIALAIIYKAVGEGAGLSIAGVNAPGHFLVRVRTETGWKIVDPFFRGEVLAREQVFERLEQIAQEPVARRDELLAAPSHQQWIFRLIGNLRQLFLAEGRMNDLAAMNELLDVLRQSNP